MARIIIGADFVPTETNFDLFTNGMTESLFGKELENELKNSTFRIFNLEVPLVDELNPIAKFGPTLVAPTNTIATYKKIGVDLLTIANNHIMDQGVRGLESTIEVLRKNNISYVGAGDNISEAIKPYIFSFCQKLIGIYACAEHEFSIATNDKAGANPFDALYSLDHIRELSEKVDYLIVLYHGGKEHYRYPSPYLQKVCRRIIDKGANLVICQHSHCIGCHEEYQSGTIVYGQGNFLFDHSNSEYWKTSLLISVDENFSIDYIPIVKKGVGVRLANTDEKNEILSAFQKRSKDISSQSFIDSEYSKFTSGVLDDYLYIISGKKLFLFKALNKLLKNVPKHLCVKFLYRRKYRLAIRNYIECEAHRELLISALSKKNL